MDWKQGHWLLQLLGSEDCLAQRRKDAKEDGKREFWILDFEWEEILATEITKIGFLQKITKETKGEDSLLPSFPSVQIQLWNF